MRLQYLARRHARHTQAGLLSNLIFAKLPSGQRFYSIVDLRLGRLPTLNHLPANSSASQVQINAGTPTDCRAQCRTYRRMIPWAGNRTGPPVQGTSVVTQVGCGWLICTTAAMRAAGTVSVDSGLDWWSMCSRA